MTFKFKASLSPELVRLKNKHFRKFPALGTLENPTKNGLLLLAKRGPELWRQWQLAFPRDSIDFKGINFSRYRLNFSKFMFLANEISFADSEFNSAQFQGCNFKGITSFDECRFIGESSFTDCSFEKMTSFDGSKFDKTDFSRCVFARKANFSRCHFGTFSSFSGAKFISEVSFKKSVFSDGLLFLHAELSRIADFSKCIFGNAANFRSTKFNIADFTRCKFLGWSDFSCESESENKTIRTISYAGAEFDGQISFENRHFDGAADFGSLLEGNNQKLSNSKFNSAPLFHGCKIHQDTNFSGAIFKDIPGQKSARAYRTLKLAMEQLKATREEQHFFRLEMKAERPSLSFPRRVLSLLYEWFSDYGFSIKRPLAGAFLFLIFFGVIHGLLANARAAQVDCADEKEIKCATSCQRTTDLFKYVLANAAPVPGLDKMQTELRKPLFGEHGLIAFGALFFEILHKIVTLVMTFLFALGLRNLFKMKS